jgi:flavin reductase (DIM6/NTAB) family NADH-FMN oxidoreductase RutF
MVIGWGHAGIIWGLPTFVIYVRQSRYTKQILDTTDAFTISAPLKGQRLSKEVFQVCGSQSGRDVEKSKLFTLIPGRKVHVPAIKECPVTLECNVLYCQDQALEVMPEEVRDRYYSHGTDVGDFHTAYIGQIVDAYVVE